MSNVTKPIMLDETGVRIAEALESITRPDFSIARKVFKTVSSMLADETLKNGDNVVTCGYYEKNDNGGANYVISSTHTGVFYLTLDNGLYANRIDENGVIPAESIGIKAYPTETENPVSSDMDRNVELFNTAHYNGIFLIFGKGHFYFSEPLRLANRGTHTVQGIDRAATILHFPNSNGLYFCDPRYYNYYVVRKMTIKSHGHCIVCDESCLTLLDSHFEWLILTSETGDCFHAPNYNVAKYVAQSGNVVYDTCVQNCVFDFINASAPQGAAFCNIMGMFTYYQHMNFVSCKYAFRNCDGIVWQTNTLGSSLEYFVYYDKVNSYSLRWMFIDVNAEVLSKAFMFTEPEVQPAQGEDPRKPDTANIMAVSITAIRSSWSLSGEHASDIDIYPITVHELGSIELLNSSRIVTPLEYPSAYNTDEVKAQIKATRSAAMNYYNGGNDIYVFSQSTNEKIKYAGNNNKTALLGIGTNGGYPNLTNRRVQSFSELHSNLIYGGKGLNVWVIKASDYNGDQINPPEDKTFFDTLVVEVDTINPKRLLNFQSTNNSNYPGRIITVHNRERSVNDLVISSANNPVVQSQSQYMLSPKCTMDIRLAPGESVQLVYTIETNPANGNKIYVWEPIDKEHIQEDPRYELLYNAIKETSSKNILPVTKGYYIKNTITSGIDVNTLVEGKASNANYGIKNVLIPCAAEDEFTIINGKGGSQNTILWSFVSASGNRLDNSGNNAKADNTVITAPANAAYLIVNSFTFPIVFKSN